ncbi:MAG: hypothetical protein JNJ77_01585 [Planctomycetia bacterium]|nr:hypothetical protein [Planctomycetia bacterium]
MSSGEILNDQESKLPNYGRNHSMYGTGLRWMSIEQVSPDKVNATLWVSLIFIPLIPLRRWLCRFAGYDGSLVFLAHEVESPLLEKLERTPVTLSSVLSTYVWALVTCCFLFSPIAFMIWWTNQRAALPFEIVLIFFWIIVVGLFPFWNVKRERGILEAIRGQEYAQACEFQRLQTKEYNKRNWEQTHYFPLWVYFIAGIAAFFIANELADFLGWNNKEVKSVFWVAFTILLNLPVYWLDRYLKKQQLAREQQASDIY